MLQSLLPVYLKWLYTHLRCLPGGGKPVRRITSCGAESRQYITIWKVQWDWNGREWCKRSKIDIGARSSGSGWGHLSIFMASVGFFFLNIRRPNKVTWLPARISLCSISVQLEIEAIKEKKVSLFERSQSWRSVCKIYLDIIFQRQSSKEMCRLIDAPLAGLREKDVASGISNKHGSPLFSFASDWHIPLINCRPVRTALVI